MYERPKIKEVNETTIPRINIHFISVLENTILIRCPGCYEMISYDRFKDSHLCTRCGTGLVLSEEVDKQIKMIMNKMNKDDVDPLTAFVRRGMMEDPKEALKYLKQIIDTIAQIANLRLLNVSSPEMNTVKINAYDKMSGIVIQYHVKKKQEEIIKGIDVIEGKGLSEKDRDELKTILENEDFHYSFTAYSHFDDIKDEKFHELRKAYLKAAEELEEYINGK